MKKVNAWGKRIIAVLLIGLLICDVNMVVLAEEIRDTTTEAYENHQQEQEYKNQLQEVEEEIIPEQEEIQEGVLPADGETPEESEENQTEEKPMTSLQLPDTYVYSDENEIALQTLYGNPVEVKEHEKVYQTDATHYVTLLTSKANTYVTKEGEEKEVDLSLVPIHRETGEECAFPEEGEIRNPELDILYQPKSSNLDISLPANVNEEQGIQISDSKGEYTLELFPEDGIYGNATVAQNALLYNGVQEFVDVQYTVDSTGVKEDIILY